MRDRMKDFWKLAAILAVLMPAVPFAAHGAEGKGQSPAAKKAPAAKAAKRASAASKGTPCPNPPPCKSGHDCSNYPFQPTACWTTEYGPARADVIIPKAGTKTAFTSPNMLYCDGNTYALCFFSGPAGSLPCELSKDGTVANCTCQAYTSKPNFVDINGILNQGAYFETVDHCGLDGGRCKNIEHCWPQDDPKKREECQKYPTAPVCEYVKNQSPGNPQGSLMPKADLISTFSFQMSGKNGPYHLGNTPCAAGKYAGCMTAPCFYGPSHTSPTQDGEQVTCQCPIYNGPYQIGQSGQSCSISPNVWSASYTVPVDAHVVEKH